MGELIRDKCQVKLKENQDADSITEVAILEAKETNKIRGLYRAIGEIPGNRSKLNRKEERS